MKASVMDVRALSAWTASLDYTLIRSVESLQPSSFVDGRRVRGLLLAPGLVLARDGQFYDTREKTAVHLSPAKVLEQYPVQQVKDMFNVAWDSTRAARRQHHHV